MNKAEKLSNAIGNINDRYILEAYKYNEKPVFSISIWKLGLAVSSLCLIVGMAALLYQDGKTSVTVYAYASNEQFAYGKTIILSGEIDDNGQMKGHPLQFYVLGSEIESIRFSCKNERISFVDWTEQRGDFGLSTNFTVPYGENEDDYYFLVVDWVPQNIIRKLTDNPDVKITDLPPEEKEDVIVMEVTYLDGGSETLAIKINLNSEGQFMVNVCDYQINEDDDFVFQQDSLPIQHQP